MAWACAPRIEPLLPEPITTTSVEWAFDPSFVAETFAASSKDLVAEDLVTTRVRGRTIATRSPGPLESMCIIILISTNEQNGH